MLVYESVVKETMLSLSEQKSNIKKLELAAKEQKNLMTQYFEHFRNKIQSFDVKTIKGTFSQQNILFKFVYN